MYLKKEDFYILEEVIDILQNIKNTNEDILSDKDIDVINRASEIVSLSNMPLSRKDYFKRYTDYLDSIRDKLIQAEQTIDDIKQDGKWKKAYDYMGTMYNRGKLKNRPTERNEYKYEVYSLYINHISLRHRYVDYFNENRTKLLKAKKTVNKIRNSDEWKICTNYFQTQKTRGLLEYAPTKENGYTYKVKDIKNGN